MKDESVGEVAAVIREVVEQIVQRPDEVKMVIGRGDDCVVLDVHVDDADVGRLIGTRGRTADALRTIAGSMGRGQRKYHLQILQGGKRLPASNGAQRAEIS